MSKNAKYNFKVRFHLGKGENYMKWQVKNLLTNETMYFNPEKTSIRMYDCKLGNKPSVSTQIFKGANKTVCAWVWCKGWLPTNPETRVGKQYRYNPRVNPHWHSSDEFNLDNSEIKELTTMGRGIFRHA